MEQGEMEVPDALGDKPAGASSAVASPDGKTLRTVHRRVVLVNRRFGHWTIPNCRHSLRHGAGLGKSDLVELVTVELRGPFEAIRVRERGLPVILISHDMPHVFELADRIHSMRLGKRGAVVTPQTHSMPEAVAIMTGATRSELERALVKDAPPDKG